MKILHGGKLVTHQPAGQHRKGTCNQIDDQGNQCQQENNWGKNDNECHKTWAFLVVITEHIAIDIYSKQKKESTLSYDELEIYVADTHVENYAETTGNEIYSAQELATQSEFIIDSENADTETIKIENTISESTHYSIGIYNLKSQGYDTSLLVKCNDN